LGGGGARLSGVFVYILVGRRQAVWSLCLYFGGEAPGCLEYLFTCDVTVTWSEVGGACHVTRRGGACYSPIGHVGGSGRGQQSPLVTWTGGGGANKPHWSRGREGAGPTNPIGHVTKSGRGRQSRIISTNQR
jgi:hypothetical protein